MIDKYNKLSNRKGVLVSKNKVRKFVRRMVGGHRFNIPLSLLRRRIVLILL